MSSAALGASAPVADAASMPMKPASGQGMQMTSRQPENDAAALAALKARNPTGAARDLRAAVASPYEPAAAKRYASRALILIGQKKGLQAGTPLTDGAGVEHLSYALAALNARALTTAAGHLKEAAALPPTARAADAALAAIKVHNASRAVTLVRARLQTLRG